MAGEPLGNRDQQGEHSTATPYAGRTLGRCESYGTPGWGLPDGSREPRVEGTQVPCSGAVGSSVTG